MKKVLVNRIDVLKALSACQAVLNKKAIFAALENVLIEAKGDKLFFRTTSLNSEMISYVTLEDPVDDFMCLVRCSVLFNTMKSIKTETVKMSLKDKEAGGHVLTVKTSKGSVKIEGDNPGDFPEEKEIGTDKYITLSSSTILDEIKDTLSFIQVNDTRPSLTCLALSLEDDMLTSKAMCPTHGSKLTYSGISNPYDLQFNIAIQKPLIAQFFNAEINDKSNIYVSDETLTIRTGRTSFTCDLYTEIKYPNVEPIYNQKDKTYIVVNPKELRDSVVRVCNLSSVEEKGGKVVEFKIKSNFDGVECSSESYLGSSSELNDILEHQDGGQGLDHDINITLNGNFLLSVLNSCDVDKCKLHYTKIEDKYTKPLFFDYSPEGNVGQTKEYVLSPMIL